VKPQTQKNSDDYEKVKTGEFISGTIDNVEYDLQHKFSYKGEEKTAQAVRLVFDLDGYEFKHRTHWMTFSYGERSNLYNKYLVKLVEACMPDMDFDLDEVKGLRIKTIWKEANGFQSVELIQPEGEKIKAGARQQKDKETDDVFKSTEGLPF
jgi:hypothetical protein